MVDARACGSMSLSCMTCVHHADDERSCAVPGSVEASVAALLHLINDCMPACHHSRCMLSGPYILPDTACQVVIVLAGSQC